MLLNLPIKKHSCLKRTNVKNCIRFLILLFLGQNLYAQQGDTVKGKALFISSCSGCHGINEVKVGPALGVPNPEIEKLGIPYVLNWVNNPKAILDKGDPYAKKIYEKYNSVIMPGFPDIKPEDLHNIKSYIDQEYQKALKSPKPNTVGPNVSIVDSKLERPANSNSDNILFIVVYSFFTLFCISLILLILYLLKIINILMVNPNRN